MPRKDRCAALRGSALVDYFKIEVVKINISILGSTGSIGTQALEVVDDLKGIKDITVKAISGNKNIRLLENQARKYKPDIVAVSDEAAAKELKIKLGDTKSKVLSGESGLIEAASEKSVDMVLSAIVGFAGLVPTIKAIEAKKNIALANKEALVTAGGLFMDKIRENNVRLIPVDSEHSAVFQCLEGNKKRNVKKILLTASGGPFFGMKKESLLNIKKEAALVHPNWSMGAKITIDSATLMNKGLEIIEAKWLFDVDIDDIEVVVHRESIIHSMVEFEDLSIMAQLSLPSMKHPIQFAFTYPDREKSFDKELSLTEIGSLTFFKPDRDVFRCLSLAEYAGKAGGTMPAAMNAANEAAVAKFLRDEIGFLEIAEFVEDIMNRHRIIKQPTLEDILNVNDEIRKEFSEVQRS